MMLIVINDYNIYNTVGALPIDASNISHCDEKTGNYEIINIQQ